MQTKYFGFVGLIIVGLCAAGLLGRNIARADIIDPFNSLSPAYVTDRYEPQYFGITNFDGDSRLAITVDDAQDAANRPSAYSSVFYNTQGRSIATGTATGLWTMSVQLYVSSGMAAGTAGPVRTDLWGATGGGADYFIIGLLSGSSDQYVNTPVNNAWWETYDDQTGVWTTSGLAVATGWNTLGIVYNGTDVEYSVNGTTIATAIDFSPATVNQLTTAYLQNRNWGSDCSQLWLRQRS